MRATWTALVCLFVILGLTGLAQAKGGQKDQGGTVSGLYVSQTNPNASVKIKHVLAREGAQPRKKIRGVFKYKDPANAQDTCMFEFQDSMANAPSIAVVDNANRNCTIRGQLTEGTLNLEVTDGCKAVYCKGAGVIPAGEYVKQAKAHTKGKKTKSKKTE